MRVAEEAVTGERSTIGGKPLAHVKLPGDTIESGKAVGVKEASMNRIRRLIERRNTEAYEPSLRRGEARQIAEARKEFRGRLLQVKEEVRQDLEGHPVLAADKMFSESGIKLADARARIAGESQRYLVGRAPVPAIMLVQAPVFYSHAFTAYAEFKAAPALEDLTARLQAGGLKVVRAKDEPPTNVNVVAEVRPVLGQPERDPGIETGVWLWGAADNLRVPSATAVAIAEKLLAS